MAARGEGGKKLFTRVEVDVAWLLVQSKRRGRRGRKRKRPFVDEVGSMQSAGSTGSRDPQRVC